MKLALYCEEECKDNQLCEAWTLSIPDQDVQKVNNTATCYLQSHAMVKIRKQAPAAFLRENWLSGFRSAIPNEYSNIVSVSHLVKGPIVTDSTTALNFPQHFSIGCTYTISLWVWLWPSKIQPAPMQAIFSTRSAQSRYYQPKDDDLFPAILLNAGSHQDRFFFSGG